MSNDELNARVATLEAEVAELKQQLEESRISASMKKSLEQFERGEGKPAVEVAMALGRKYGAVKS